MLGSSSFVRRAGVGATVAACALLAREPDARACGGYFPSPSGGTQTVDTIITAHRMVFSISTAQTVLWDQIQYSGAPSGFAWVLPIKPGAVLQLSNDAWIGSIDAATQTVIQSPTTTCAAPDDQDVGDDTGGGCGSSSAGGTAGFEPSAGVVTEADAGTVQVVSQQVVGPYDAVTVHSSQGQALGAWLTANGYNVAASLQPLIDAFTTEGFDFIALKLAPGEGVQAMQPVRVVTEGADLSLPLRMVAAGAGANVAIELWVLGEGVYQPQNFPQSTIDFSQLLWDPSTQVSNYTTLASSALATSGGRSWLTESAGPVPLGSSSGPNPPLDVTYEQSCVPQTITPPQCDDDAGADGGTCAPTVIPCDDLDVAMTGITDGSFYVTRMRASLPSSALAADLVLEAAASQATVPSFHVATGYTVPNYNPCPAGSTNGATSSSQTSACATTTRRGTRHFDAILLAIAAVGIGLTSRRSRRRRRAA
jgi:hypothetical protein